MLCYLDRSFCSATDCTNAKCSVRLSEEDSKNADKWAEENSIPPLICFSSFKDGPMCPGYIKEEVADEV